jgi:integrase/recombinase XerD
MQSERGKPTKTSLRFLYDRGATQISLSLAVETFLRIESRDWSRSTTTWYRRRLETFQEALGADRLLSDLLEPDIEDYIVKLKERKTKYVEGDNRPKIEGDLSPYTLHGHVRAIRRFFRWLHEKDILPVDLTSRLSLPRLPKQGRKGISEASASLILEAAKENTRDYALLLFLYSTGVRVGGLAHLKLSDLNINHPKTRIQKRATVREKGDKERSVVMSGEALQALIAWMEERPDVEDDHVFLGASPGQRWHGLKESGIRQILKRYKDRLGIDEQVSPHQWRHRWFRSSIQAGMPISHVSQLGGHSDIKVTDQFYGQFSIDQLQDSYEKYVETPETHEESLDST